MTEIEYEAIGNALAKIPYYFHRAKVVRELIDFFSARDPKFDREKFIKSAGFSPCSECGEWFLTLRGLFNHKEENHRKGI